MYKGLDLSQYNVVTDFNKVKEDGIQFIFLREGYGVNSGPDKVFFQYVRGFREVGLPVLGVYHFTYALNEEDVIKEAQHTIENVQKAELPKPCFIAFDFEYDTMNYMRKKGISPTRAMVNNHTRLFCDYVKKEGYYPMVYTNIDYYKNWYDKTTLDRYDIWLADYNGGPNYDCIMQQTGSKGTVKGINGYVDTNILYSEIMMKDVYSEEELAPVINNKKSNEVLAHEVIAGKWGNGPDRKQKLTEAGYDYSTIQKIVNDILNGKADNIPIEKPAENTLIDIVAAKDPDYYNSVVEGSYETTADLYMRNGAGTNNTSFYKIPKGTLVKCFGYYSVAPNGIKWLYIQANKDTTTYKGFSCINYLNKK